MKRKTLIYISILVIFITFICLAIYVYKWEYREPLFEVNFFSLKRGRSLFIRSPDNKTILIGGGQNSEIISKLTKVMPFYSRKIDYVFVPSATPSQIGGLIEIIDRYNVGETVMPKIMATSTVLTQLLKEIRKNKIHVEEVGVGDSFDIGSIKVEVIFPREDFKFNKSSLPELAVFLSYNKTSAYLLGNLSKTIQKDILKNIKIETEDNLLEYFNSASEVKVSDELVERIKPKFIFSTKEKQSKWVSDGDGWKKI